MGEDRLGGRNNTYKDTGAFWEHVVRDSRVLHGVELGKSRGAGKMGDEIKRRPGASCVGPLILCYKDPEASHCQGKRRKLLYVEDVTRRPWGREGRCRAMRLEEELPLISGSYCQADTLCIDFLL